MLEIWFQKEIVKFVYGLLGRHDGKYCVNNITDIVLEILIKNKGDIRYDRYYRRSM